MTRKIQADCKTIADLLEISSPRARAVLAKMVKEEIIITEGGNRNRIYKLKSYLDYASNIEISDKAPQDYVYHYRQKLGEDGYRKACEEHALPKNFEGMEYMEFLSQRRILMAKTVRKAYQRLCE